MAQKRRLWYQRKHQILLPMVTLLLAAGLFQPKTLGEVGKDLHWQEPIEIDSGGAIRGPWRMNESNFDFVDDPSIAVGSGDRIGVVWARNAEQDIFFQSLHTDGTPYDDAEPVNVSNNPGIFSWLPRLVFLDEEIVLVLWQEIVFSGGSHGGEIFFARSVNGGKSFSEPENLSQTTAGAGKGRLTQDLWDNGSLDIVQSTGNNVYIAWTEYEGTLWFRHSSDAGKHFEEARRIVSEAGKGREAAPARGPSLAASPDGTVYLAWTVGEDPWGNIYLARSENHGKSFSSPRMVHTSEAHSDAPSLIVDSEGTLHLAYAEAAQGIRSRYHILYTRSNDGGESFETPRVLVPENAHGGYSVHYPRLALDGEDRLYLNWENFPQRTPRPRGLGISYSIDGGNSFSNPVLIEGTDNPDLGFSGSQQGLLMRKLSAGHGDGPFVVNSTFREGRSSRILLYRTESE